MTAPLNILVIQTDAQHHQWLGFRGTMPVRTPHLDRLARERAVAFDRAYSCSGVCVPSRTSLMTGRYTIGHGVVNNHTTPRPDREPWLGRLLRDAGYRTGYFGKTHFAGNDHDMPGEGWDESFLPHDYLQYLRDHHVAATYPEKTDIDRRPMRFWTMGTSRIPREHYLENVLGDRATAFLRRADQPFAAYVSFVAPHGPFTPPKPYDTMYDPADMPLLPRVADELADKPPATARWIAQNRKYLNDDELRQWLALTFGLVSMVDDNVGRIRAALDERGLTDRTLIVFLSDHGDFATRYGILGKSWSMRDDLLRIPLLVAHPDARRRAGTRCDALVQSIDVHATLLRCAGIEPSSRTHGRSLLPLLTGEAESVRDAVFAHDQSHYSGGHWHATMMRGDRWKLVESTGFRGELYDLHADPDEHVNRIDDPAAADVRDAMRREMLQWHLEHTGGYFDQDRAAYWEDQTQFYDESKFCGERLYETQRVGKTL